MVVTYLEKIKDNYLEEKIDIQAKLNESLNHKKENAEIIKLLEQSNDENFEAFTPRMINSFNKTKIIELKEEQKKIEVYIEELNGKLKCVEEELIEVSEVINIAKEKLM